MDVHFIDFAQHVRHVDCINIFAAANVGAGIKGFVRFICSNGRGCWGGEVVHLRNTGGAVFVCGRGEGGIEVTVVE